MKVGILGGTFDPIHKGHLLIAEQAIAKVGLEQVWFIPTAVSPHKTENEVTSAYHRAEMVKLAIAPYPYFRFSSIELDRSGISYTVDTLETLCEKYPNIEFHFIVGTDMVNDLPNWYKIERIIQLSKIIGVYRPQVPLKEIPIWISHRLIWIQEDIGIHVSSSFIRKHVNQRSLLQYVLPSSIYRYIEENRLYGYSSNKSFD